MEKHLIFVACFLLIFIVVGVSTFIFGIKEIFTSGNKREEAVSDFNKKVNYWERYRRDTEPPDTSFSASIDTTKAFTGEKKILTHFDGFAETWDRNGGTDAWTQSFWNTSLVMVSDLIDEETIYIKVFSKYQGEESSWTIDFPFHMPEVTKYPPDTSCDGYLTLDGICECQGFRCPWKSTLLKKCQKYYGSDATVSAHKFSRREGKSNIKYSAMSCLVLGTLNSVCLTFSEKRGLWELESKNGCHYPFTTPGKYDWYDIQSELSVYIELRNEFDPYFAEQKLTYGSMDFGPTTGHDLIKGIFMVFFSIPFTCVPCFIGCIILSQGRLGSVQQKVVPV